MNDDSTVPTWQEGIDRLLGKLDSLVADGAVTVNDARVIRHLAGCWQEQEPGRELIRGVREAWDKAKADYARLTSATGTSDGPAKER